MTKVDFYEAAQFLKEHDRYVLLCHAYPDGDTVGAASALCRGLRTLGKAAYVACPHKIPSKFADLCQGLLECDFEEQTVVAVDVADDKLLGKLQPEYGGRVDLCIDHHPSNTGYAKRLCLDPVAAATCENIYEILQILEIPITKEIAQALFVGISTDTGCFKYANVRPKTHLIASELMKTGIETGEINRLLFDTKTKARVELERMILDGMTFHFEDRCAVVTITSEMRRTSGSDENDLDGISALARSIEGVIIGVTMQERGENRYKISIRTHEPVDASAICGKLGGGGHKRAAGCELSGPVHLAKEKLLSVIEGALV